MRLNRPLLALLVCAATALLPPSRTTVTAQPAAEVRALWVTRSTLTSATAIAQMVMAAQQGGFNTLVVQVRGRGDAYYRSNIEPRAAELASQPDFDPLEETIRLARGAGMQVHTWIAVNLISSAFELPASRQHIVYRQPEWLMVPRQLAAELLTVDARNPAYVGKLARWTRAHSEQVEGLYASPVHPGAVSHLTAVVTDLAQRYEVDGVHLDYARYPGADFDYSRPTLQQFKAATQAAMTEAERRHADAREAVDPLAYPNLYPRRWEAFRQSRLTALIMRLRTAIKAVRPRAQVSAAVVPDAELAATTRFQDWRTWLDQSLIDVLCPMAYATDVDVFERQIAAAQDLAGERPVWAGIGAYRLSHGAALQHIAAARRLKAAGIILFSYDALITPPNSLASLTNLGRAAFGGSN